MPTPLLELEAGDDPAAWRRLGFAVDGSGACRIGPVTMRFDGGGGGLRGWTLGGPQGDDEVDGIATDWAPGPLPAESDAAHPNRAMTLDHVVVFTDDRDRTVEALVGAGGDLRRRADPPAVPAPMAFVRFDATIVEVAQSADADGARLWGVVAVVPDVDALARTYGELLGSARGAVQPGRRIVTAARAPGLDTALAFLTPREWAR